LKGNERLTKEKELIEKHRKQRSTVILRITRVRIQGAMKKHEAKLGFEDGGDGILEI
jgi:hypothetical protein